MRGSKREKYLSIRLARGNKRLQEFFAKLFLPGSDRRQRIVHTCILEIWFQFERLLIDLKRLCCIVPRKCIRRQLKEYRLFRWTQFSRVFQDLLCFRIKTIRI